MSTVPDWWKIVEPEIDGLVENFVIWIRRKLETTQPQKFISKNPFLYRARSYDNSAEKLADRLIEAFLSSSEETKFGDILEEIAICVCKEAKNGRKSSTLGIDLEFEDNNGYRTIVQIKSGVNWGNSSQRKKLVSDFQTATKVLRQSTGFLNIDRETPIQNITCVEGICYGPSRIKDLGSHFQIVGDEFWELISGWNGTAYAVLQIIGDHSGNGMSDVREATRNRIVSYLKDKGAVESNSEINWERLLEIVMMSSK